MISLNLDDDTRDFLTSVLMDTVIDINRELKAMDVTEFNYRQQCLKDRDRADGLLKLLERTP